MYLTKALLEDMLNNIVIIVAKNPISVIVDVISISAMGSALPDRARVSLGHIQTISLYSPYEAGPLIKVAEQMKIAEVSFRELHGLLMIFHLLSEDLIIFNGDDDLLEHILI